MTKWQKTTVIFVILLIAVITVYDVIAIQQGGKEASISNLLIVWSHEYPSFTFGIGFVCGHLFWRMKNVYTLSKAGNTEPTTKGEQ